MAKRQQTKQTPQQNPSVEFQFMSLSMIWNNGGRLPMDLALRLILSELIEVPNPSGNGLALPSPFDPLIRNSRRDKMFILVGEQGVSKTTGIRQGTAKNGLAITMMEFAGTEVEDNLPITLNTIDPETGQPMRRGFGHLYRPPQSSTGKGVCLVNEALGADIRQQQQMRAFLSNRQLAGVPIHDDWILVGDTNPATAEFSDNRQQTRSLEARCFYLPVTLEFQDWMDYSSGNNKLNSCVLPERRIGKPVPVTPFNTADGSGGFYEPLYLFLRMQGGNDEKSYWKAADPRRWTNIGDSLARQAAGGLVSAEESMQWMRLVLPEEVVNDYSMFLQKGNDPDEYPIPGHRWMQAEKAEHQVHLKRLDGWKTHTTRNVLTSFTVAEIQSYLRNKQNLTVLERNNLKDFLLAVSDTQTALVLEQLHGTVSDEAWRLIKNTHKENRVGELIEKMDEVEI